MHKEFLITQLTLRGKLKITRFSCLVQPRPILPTRFYRREQNKQGKVHFQFPFLSNPFLSFFSHLQSMSLPLASLSYLTKI